MAEKKIIAVLGATGAQGGGLVRAILDDPDGGFAARAITRDPDSDKARALADQGAEVVAADLDDAQSLERALAGAHGAYFVTFFWDHFSPDREKAQARSMAEAAKAVGLRHAIWSTLEDTRRWVPLTDDRMPTLMGEYKVPHFDAKGEANAYFTGARGAHHLPAHVVLLGQPDPFRDGAQAGSRRPARLHPAHGRQETPRDRRGGHRPLCLRHLQGRRSVHRPYHRDCGGASHRRPDGRGARPRAGRGGDLPRRSPRRSTAPSVSRGPRTWATCSSSSTTSRPISAAPGT